MAQLYRYTGEFAAAHALLDESLAIGRQAGSKAEIAGTLHVLRIVTLDEGDPDRSQQFMEESVALRRAMSDNAFLSKTLVWIGEVARSRGDYDTARDAYQEAVSLHNAVSLDLGYLLHNLGHVAHSQGDYQRAEALFADGLSIILKGEDTDAAIACMAGPAATAAELGKTERAGRLFSATDALIAALGVHMEVADRLAYDRNLAQARAHCDRAVWEAAWTEGRALSLEQALAYALENV